MLTVEHWPSSKLSSPVIEPAPRGAAVYEAAERPFDLNGVLAETLTQHPGLRRPLAEMAAADWETFFHSYTQAELFRNLSLETVGAFPWMPQNDRLIRQLLPGQLTHDIGKEFVASTVEESNHWFHGKMTPQALDPNSSGDSRSPLQRAVQRLHPLTGGFGLQIIGRELAEGDKRVRLEDYVLWSQFAFGHHELFARYNYVSQDGRSAHSYPRAVTRLEGEMRKALFDTEIADRISAMGYPRSYRQYPLQPDVILDELPAVVNQASIRTVFPELSPDQVEQTFQFYLKASLRALHRSYQTISPIHYFRPEKVLFQGQPFFVPEDKSAPMLNAVAQAVWSENGERLHAALQENMCEEGLPC